MVVNNFQYAQKERISNSAYFIKYATLDGLILPYLNQNSKVCLYFDTKNILSLLHSLNEQQDIMKSYMNKSDEWIIARSIIVLANHWMRYFKKKNISCTIFFFDERGSSIYHNNHSKEYKANRAISKQRIASDLLKDEEFFNKFYVAYDRNIALISGLFARLNNLFYIKLKDLESDFIPKLIMNEYFTANGKIDPSFFHIILSSDKDYCQLLEYNNVIQLYKDNKEKNHKIRSKFNALESFTQIAFIDNHKLRNPKFIPLLLSIAGDTSDNVIGLSGIGYKTVYNYINELYKDNIITDEDYTMDKFLFKLKEYAKLNPKILSKKDTKLILSNEDLLLKNYKLTSFEELLNWLDYKIKKNILTQMEKEPSNDEQRVHLLSQLCLVKTSFDFLI